jgi:hypothetical protein
MSLKVSIPLVFECFVKVYLPNDFDYGKITYILAGGLFKDHSERDVIVNDADWRSTVTNPSW